jgi:hypothetical protein
MDYMLRKNLTLFLLLVVLSGLIVTSYFYHKTKNDLIEEEAQRKQMHSLVDMYNEVINDPFGNFKVPDNFSKSNLDDDWINDHIGDIERFMDQFSLSEDSLNYDELYFQKESDLNDAYALIEEMTTKHNKDISQMSGKIDSLNQLNRSLRHLMNEREKRINRGKSIIDSLNRSLKEIEINKKEMLTFSSPTGVEITYFGRVKDGKAHGAGIGIYKNGNSYEGSWRNNKRHGYGAFSWVSGERYEGNFVDGKIEGEGSYFWPSGERYVGSWINNQRHGMGTQFDKNGNIIYKGNWEYDVPLK